MRAPRLLLLEDDAELQQVISLLLKAEGYSVVTASRGEEALLLAEADAFDLVIVDVRMEGMDGLETLERIYRENPDLGTLVITGYTSEADTIRAVRLGVGDFLKKPFEPEELLRSVSKVLTRRGHLLQQRDHEERLRRSLLWAVQLLARGKSPDPPAIAHIVRRLGQLRGLSDEATDWAELAALVRGIGEPSQVFPQPLQDVLDHLDERWDERGPAIPVESRIAALALGSDRPGQCDPELGRALAQVPTARTTPVAGQRSLLALAEALASTGQARQAEQVLRRVVADPAPTQERLEALMSLARLALEQGRREDLLGHCREAAAAAEQGGPGPCFRVWLEAGRMLAHERDPGGVELIRRAGRLARQRDDRQGQALALLALESVEPGAEVAQLEGAFNLLLAPDAIPTLTGAAPWLIELLKQRPLPFEAAQRARHRLLRDFPKMSAGMEAAGPPLDQAAPLLRIHSTQNFEVFIGDRRVPETDWKTTKVKFLLARLAAQRAQAVPEELLLEAFYPEDPARGRKNLYWCTTMLRRALKCEAWKVDPVLRGAGAIFLNPELPRWHDYEDLQDLLTAYALESKAAPKVEFERYRRVLELYRGPYLEGAYWEWAQEIRGQLELRVGELLLALVGWALEREPREALEYARRALQIDPCLQEAHAGVMRAHLLLNHPEEAVRQFLQASSALKRELGMEPSLEMLELHQRARLSVH